MDAPLSEYRLPDSHSIESKASLHRFRITR